MVETSEENLPDVCNIVTIDYDRGPRGEVSEVAVTGPDFACRIRPVGGANLSSREALILQRLGVIEAWNIKAPKAITVRLQDRILVDVDGAGARLMEVVASPGLKSRQTVDSYMAVEVK